MYCATLERRLHWERIYQTEKEGYEKRGYTGEDNNENKTTWCIVLSTVKFEPKTFLKIDWPSYPY
jgi:hypothetical protein